MQMQQLTSKFLADPSGHGGWEGGGGGCALIKKIIRFSSYIRKFRMEQLQSRPPHIWGNICAFPHILGSPSSYMTLQLLHCEFPYI
jgi:hypothetical protein